MMLNNILYMYAKMDNSSQILLFLIILVALMLVSIFIINTIIKKKNQAYDRKYNPITKYSTVVEPKVKEEPIKVKEDFEDIETLDDSEVVEIVSDDNSIDKISMLIEDNINNQKPIDLTKFEEEEERNAIISYDELVRKAGAKKIIYKTEDKEIIKETKKEEIKEDNKSKFKASQVISPIYGLKKRNEEKEEFIEIDNISLKDKKNISDSSMQKDMNFLNNLKTFRSNLD